MPLKHSQGSLKIMWKSHDISHILKKTMHPRMDALQMTGVSTDTRKIKKGDLFIALKGTHFDGHEYIESAFDKGASAAVVQQAVNHPCWVVPDTLYALGELARAWRKRFPIKVVAITGTNGKTTTKEMLVTVLQSQYHVLKNEGNFNNFV